MKMLTAIYFNTVFQVSSGYILTTETKITIILIVLVILGLAGYLLLRQRK